MSTSPEHSEFAGRHLGPGKEDIATMLSTLEVDSLDELIDSVVPAGTRSKQALQLPPARSEYKAVSDLREIVGKNEGRSSFIGQGYYGTILPPVIQRNVLENPGWYTAYTPYQAEISQGRLEALLNYQTLICELTALPVANASLLDEGTAASEAMAMAAGAKPKGKKFFVSRDCFSQTIDVLHTRAEPIGIELIVTDLDQVDFDRESDDIIGVLVQYPDANGTIVDFTELSVKVHAAGGLVVVAADILALTLLKPPGEWGADIAVGSSQRFGVPMGFGGPHAAYMACTDSMKRRLPGRLVGVSKDSGGRPALRLALQTREQHIRREKATSNICTAQVLLAVIAGFYAVYHGRDGLRHIASRISSATATLKKAIDKAGFETVSDCCFDTLSFRCKGEEKRKVIDLADREQINLYETEDGVSLSLDEVSIETGSWKKLATVFGLDSFEETIDLAIPDSLLRSEDFLQQPVFSEFHTETGMLRYLRRLEGKDIALNWSMIPLGSCTMKLNATSEMLPLSWSTINSIHPFTPSAQVPGYLEMIGQLEQWLCEITGFAGVSLQPNAGSQGEYAGLLAIRQYHLANDDHTRDICLIPVSAHGTNPASAVMAGMKVVPVKCDEDGNIDIADVKEKAEKYSDSLSSLMITYPSTHGVFEESVKDICEIIHTNGGQVYMDGANLNAQVGLCSPGGIGADVCHLNLHKTFCIPHGGGGPGVGPIGVAEHLVPYLPGHRVLEEKHWPVCSAPFGSASILPISWMYIAMMGAEGLTNATRVAILNANYIAKRLGDYYPVLYRGKNGYVAHECIIDLRPLKELTGIDVEDVAKRLIDFGFHAPTMSWPVAGTLMIEPTESEDLAELDRFCDAMIAIFHEIKEVESGNVDAQDNALKNAPHTAEDVVSDNWQHAYTREQAAYPLKWVKESKFWPTVSRIDNVFGDRNLVCTCEGMDAYSEE